MQKVHKSQETRRFLRGIMRRQLSAFRSGKLSLFSNDVDVSESAMSDLEISLAKVEAEIADADRIADDPPDAARSVDDTPAG